ncbi:PAS domain-containing protein, partial [Jeotgalibaca porci]
GRKLFPRTRNAIGREVYNCHPPKSQSIVRKLIADFKAGTKDIETLWFQTRGTYVMVTYAAVRDDDGSYMGTLEWVQDIQHIIDIDEEKRTID